ncbi:EutN/CcmL family microcompartment protein [Calycomorphotria hydatis]|uniref:Ethanolamine utilization protein EutN/carboxysome n=1 Tax=Calycomorphotria hydatis TaxID=2528027 RepID=A0A517T3G2_9PLAN|nr:EutN/CcmL family microcompartment protein [Calycomorphotria hydatis]QDT62910.1 Ethanolamine utilization protein EutN/carboxysome [Calycomorphotria hydatis]
MKIGQVIGSVTLSTEHAAIRGGRWRLVVPLTAEGIAGDAAGRGEPFVMYDEWNVGEGSLVAIGEGPEAAAPFLPDIKPIDAYNAAILDAVEIQDKV